MKLLLIFILSLMILTSAKFTTYSIQDAKEKEITVSISGCVIHEGEYNLTVYSTLQDLIDLATLQDNCDISMYNLNMPLKDGDVIDIPFKTEAIKISINSSSLEELCLLPGIGEKIAQRIIDYRSENGLFQNIEDITNVSGIGDAKFQKIKEYICL